MHSIEKITIQNLHVRISRKSDVVKEEAHQRQPSIYSNRARLPIREKLPHVLKGFPQSRAISFKSL